MTTQRTFAQRMGFYIPCVAPATVIIPSDNHIDCGDGEILSSLRSQVSSEDLCYLYVKRIEHASHPEEGEEDLYVAYVASSPAVIAFDHATMLLSETQLRYTLPWDERLKNENPESIIAQLHAHASALQPVVPHNVERVTGPPSQPEVTLTCMKPIEVNAQDVQTVLEGICEQGKDNAMSGYRVQQAFLRATLYTLLEKLSSQGLFVTENGVMRSEQTPAMRALHLQCAIVAKIQQWHRKHRQTVVKATPIYGDGNIQTAWCVMVGVPALAA